MGRVCVRCAVQTRRRLLFPPLTLNMSKACTRRRRTQHTRIESRAHTHALSLSRSLSLDIRPRAGVCAFACVYVYILVAPARVESESECAAIASPASFWCVRFLSVSFWCSRFFLVFLFRCLLYDDTCTVYAYLRGPYLVRVAGMSQHVLTYSA